MDTTSPRHRGMTTFAAIVLIAAVAGIVSLPLLFFVPIPPLAAWPWLILSVITHLGYYIGLSRAFRASSSAFRRASSICCRSSANVVTLKVLRRRSRS